MTDQTSSATHLAQQHIATELGCDQQELHVIEVEAVEWSDSALGCPQPGMMYMQVITPGFRITLERAGQRYLVHTDRGTRAVRCDRPQPGKGPASRM